MNQLRYNIFLTWKYRMAVVCLAVFLCLVFRLSWVRAEETEKITFKIHSFHIGGNTLLDREMLTSAVKKFMGPGKTAEDVELARDALEQMYHKNGYPTVLVNIPEQTVDEGVIRLQVIESMIKRVRVVGNKYFTMENIKGHLPGLQPGKVLFLPEVKEQLADLNRNPDLKIAPILIPGRALGTIDVELKVEDHLPLHGSLELNNRATHTTTQTRLNGMIRYDNLWQKNHSINTQFQTAPEKTDEVLVFSGSYAMPSLWDKKHLMVGYCIYSDSEIASGEGFNVIGKGEMIGFRYMFPLSSMQQYDHNLTLGFDWKNFEEDTQGTVTPIEYVPFTIGYSSMLTRESGDTRFSADLNFLIRDFLGNDMEEFTRKRAGATGNYIYLTLGAEHRQKLPAGFSAFFKLDGQIADQPLVNNEQFSAGGVASVRGYKESEVLADNALHSTLEIFSPSLIKQHILMPYLFYDCAWLDVREALLEQKDRTFIQGAGIGLTGNWKNTIDFKLDLGFALENTDNTDSGDMLLHFKTRYQF